MRHLISLEHLDVSQIDDLISRGVEFSSDPSRMKNLLKDKIIGIYFRKTSTRTRTSFTSAALRMGAKTIAYGPNDLQENTGETMEDTTKVLSRMLDGFVARTAGSCEEMSCFASQDRMAVVNAMTAREHPTQAIADLITLKQSFGEIKGLNIAYFGEGNNTAAALAMSLSLYKNTVINFYTPNGYGLERSVWQKAEQLAAKSGAQLNEYHTFSYDKDNFKPDVIYTTRWETTGTTKADRNWRNVFEEFKVTKELMNIKPDTIFMHDLPAHRGDEVETEVIDGPKSIVFDQAENKLYCAASVLDWCLG